MTLDETKVLWMYHRLVAAMDLMRPTLEYIGCHEDCDPACAKGLEFIKSVIETLAEDRNIHGKDHPHFWEWLEDEDWSARIRQGAYAGSEYAIHRQYIKKRYGIDLPEPVYAVTDTETIRKLILEHVEEKGDFWPDELAVQHHLDIFATLDMCETLASEGVLQQKDPEEVKRVGFKAKTK